MNEIIIPVNVGGITFKNPFFVASGPTTKKVSQLKRIEQTGWAAASIKLTIDPAPYINRKPRYALFDEYKALAFTTEKRLAFEDGLKLVSDAKKELTDLKLFANITYAGDDGLPGWVNMAKRFEEVGADAIELNMCCPNMSYNVELTTGDTAAIAKKTGASLGQQADAVAEIVRAIKKEIAIPLFVKLTPEGGHIAQVAKSLYAAGADAVGGTANRLGIPRIDIDNPEKAVYHLQEEISMSCYCGEWLKPLAQRDTYEIRKLCGDGPAITAAGGVRGWRDAVEMILCGANLVGVCSETLISGYDIVRPMLSGLKDYMDSHGYGSPLDFCGKIVPAVKTAPEVTLYGGYAKVMQPKLYAPCKSACPLHVPAQAYVQSIARGDYAGAYRLISSVGPMQEICALICEHPCEKACVRGRADSPIKIRELKKFVVDYAKRNKLAPSYAIGKDSGRKAAVIGSGATGLSAAYALRSAGHEVTVYDCAEKPGGGLRSATVRFKITDADIDSVIEQLKGIGVKFVMGKRLGADFTVESLKKDGFGAVVVAIGAGSKGEYAFCGAVDGVVDTVDFIKSTVDGAPAQGGRAVVIGDCDEASDAARAAVRLGCDEVVLAVSSGGSASYKDAVAEGVKLVCDVKINSVDEQGGKIKAAVFDNVKVAGAQLSLDCNLLLSARPRSVDSDAVAPLTIENGRVKTDRATAATSLDGVFCAGDCAFDTDFIGAVSSGATAAYSAGRYLSGEAVSARPRDFSTVRAEDVLKRNGYIPNNPNPIDNERAPSQRTGDFELCERVFTEQEAKKEAARCLNCGCGEGCQLCKTICTDFAPYIADCDTIAINSQECVACGMCFNRCPNGNIEMINTNERV